MLNQILKTYKTQSWYRHQTPEKLNKNWVNLGARNYTRANASQIIAVAIPAFKLSAPPNLGMVIG